MKPQDIDKIAGAVVESLAGGPGLLGCGSFTNQQRYDNPPGGCEAEYQCGGMGAFTCCQSFTCLNGFLCPGPATFGCINDVGFTCSDVGFSCGSQDTFQMTSQLCCTAAFAV